VAAGSNSLENVSFNLYAPGLLAFAPGVGTYYLGSLNTTNAQTLALQDTAGGTISLVLGKNNADMTPSVAFGGAGGLEKIGTGTLSLTNAHTYAGATRVSGGTLRLGDGVRDCALTNSSSLTANATVAFNTAANQTYANPVYGAGTITKAGAGTLTLNNLQMRPGVVTVNGGTLALSGANGTLLTTSGYTVSGGTLLLDNTAANNTNRLRDASAVTLQGWQQDADKPQAVCPSCKCGSTHAAGDLHPSCDNCKGTLARVNQ
jgi:autotransporter-associated beta strand protein